MVALDAIDWSALEHAYGPASDVPAILADLRSSNGTVREEAFLDLHHRLLHQYVPRWFAPADPPPSADEPAAPLDDQAVLYVIPFLADMLREPQLPDKHRILIILRDLNESLLPDETALQRQLELAGEAVMDALGDAEVRVVAHASCTLVAQPTPPSALGQRLVETSRRLSQEALSAVLIAVGEHFRGHGPAKDTATGQLLTHLRGESDVVVAGAATALARLGYGRAVAMDLLKATGMSRLVDCFPWYDGHISLAAIAALREFDLADCQDLLQRALELRLARGEQFDDSPLPGRFSN